MPRGGRRAGLVLLSLCLLAVAALGVALVLRSLQSPPATPVANVAVTSSSPPEQCHSSNGLPDPVCTPGWADPRVTQDNIRTTICVTGYTTTIRPSSGYTNALKVQQIKAYGYSDTRLADYEEDHLIPLELGGHPTNPKNLWPEPRSGAHTATTKDGIENSLHSRVCAGLMTVAAAQTAIASNWEAA